MMKNSKWLIALLSFVIASCEDSCEEKKPLWSGEGLYGIRYRIQCASTVPSCDHRRPAIEISMYDPGGIAPNIIRDTMYICCESVPDFLDSSRIYQAQLPAVRPPALLGIVRHTGPEEETWRLLLLYEKHFIPTDSLPLPDTLTYQLRSCNWARNPPFGLSIEFHDPAHLGYFLSQVDSVFKTCCLE
jgi:hypothetical protein